MCWLASEGKRSLWGTEGQHFPAPLLPGMRRGGGRLLWGREELQSVLGCGGHQLCPGQPLPEDVTPPGGHRVPQQRGLCERKTPTPRALLPWIAAGCPWAARAGWGLRGERYKLCSSDSVLISSSSVPGLHLHSLILKCPPFLLFFPPLSLFFFFYFVQGECRAVM